MAIYNDGSYIIHDKVADTYTVGSWRKFNQYAYNITEPGKYGPSWIIGGHDDLQFQYNGTDPLPGREWVDYERITYEDMIRNM